MLTPPIPSAPGSPEERRLVRLFRAMDQADRHALTAFATFLAEARRPKPGSEVPQAPQPLPRPEDESVIGAVRRLSKSYAMIDRTPMLDETSKLVSAHLLQGRAAGEVIDQLEVLFERHYQVYRAGLEAPNAAVGDPSESNT